MNQLAGLVDAGHPVVLPVSAGKGSERAQRHAVVLDRRAGGEPAVALGFPGVGRARRTADHRLGCGAGGGHGPETTGTGRPTVCGAPRAPGGLGRAVGRHGAFTAIALDWLADDSRRARLRRLRDWNEAGVWSRPHEVLHAELHSAGRLGRDRAVIDTSHVRAARRGSQAGRARSTAPGRAPSTTSRPTAAASRSRSCAPLATATTSPVWSRCWTRCPTCAADGVGSADARRRSMQTAATTTTGSAGAYAPGGITPRITKAANGSAPSTSPCGHPARRGLRPGWASSGVVVPRVPVALDVGETPVKLAWRRICQAHGWNRGPATWSRKRRRARVCGPRRPRCSTTRGKWRARTVRPPVISSRVRKRPVPIGLCRNVFPCDGRADCAWRFVDRGSG